MEGMETRILDGKALAERIRGGLREDIARDGLSPCLATVLVGEDPASAVYVRMKTRDALEIGIRVKDRHLPADISQADLERELDALNADPEVDGILLQLPLPGHLDEEVLLARIDPTKDVDGFHPANLGRLVRNQPGLRACTPLGCMDLLAESGVDPRGREAVVVGRSNIVGKPVALLLLAADATVTVAHSRTADLAAVVGRADIVVAAAGRAGLVRGEWIRPGAVVIDVGTNRLPDGRLVGDVEFDAALGRAAAITPVPGGVGPMTRIHLMRNTVLAHRARRAASGG
jgi:methylenetetrahydrofolate dehydrogenase (NADP+)/methenyltetrahydrofolate cyclohydrolase